MKGEFMGFRAVIFDMDGVLIDSEYLYLTGIHRELQKNGPGSGRRTYTRPLEWTAPGTGN